MPVDPQIQTLLDQGTGVQPGIPAGRCVAQYEARIALMAQAAR